MSKEDLLKRESSDLALDRNKFSTEIDQISQDDTISSIEKKNTMEDFLVEKTINKWLNLQKIIKEEITLEDVIIKQQQEDTKNLKSYFIEYFKIKLNTRKNWNDIKELKLVDDKQPNISSTYSINEDLGNFHEASEPIKNLFFILRNNYDYLTRLISLISPEDFNKNSDNINSLVELLNNNFYENILIPNPEQQELLILIYKLLEKEIVPMMGVCPQNFLKDDTISGIFLSSFAKKQEIIGYFSMILNYLILSIDDNDSKEIFDLNINNIANSLDKELNEFKKGYSNSEINYKSNNNEINIKNILFNEIPKINIKFKNSFELEAEKEKEDERKYTLDENGIEKLSVNYPNKIRKTVNQKYNFKFGNKEHKNNYNSDYKRDLTQNKLVEKILKESDPELKKVYKKLLDQTINYPNKYTNEGLLRLLRAEIDKKSEGVKKLRELVDNFKYNFLYIKDIIEYLLQIIIDKIIILPYPLRCICKIIKILILKKFPELTKYEVNSFIGKFILDKCIFPILRLENKIFLDPRVYSKKTKNCLDVIISVLSKANNASLFDTYLDPEKTIFNQFILEIIPILNKFYDKIIDIKLPKVIEELITKTVNNLENSPNKSIFKFRNSKQNNANDKDKNIEKSENSNTQEQKPLFEYFGENPDEILHLQSICFSAADIKYILDLISRDINLFKDLPRFSFFSKTYNKIKNQNEIINALYN